MSNSPFPDVTPQFEEELLQFFKLLADHSRLRILVHLARTGEKNVSDLCAMLEQSQPAVSHHLGLLRIGGLITMRRAGKSNFYSVSGTRFSLLINRLVESTNGRVDEIRFNNVVLRLDSPEDSVSQRVKRDESETDTVSDEGAAATQNAAANNELGAQAPEQHIAR